MKGTLKMPRVLYKIFKRAAEEMRPKPVQRIKEILGGRGQARGGGRPNVDDW